MLTIVKICEYIVTGSLVELKHSASLFKTFPVGWVGGWETLKIRLNSGQLELELCLSFAMILPYAGYCHTCMYFLYFCPPNLSISSHIRQEITSHILPLIIEYDTGHLKKRTFSICLISQISGIKRRIFSWTNQSTPQGDL